MEDGQNEYKNPRLQGTHMTIVLSLDVTELWHKFTIAVTVLHRIKLVKIPEVIGGGSPKYSLLFELYW